MTGLFFVSIDFILEVFFPCITVVVQGENKKTAVINTKSTTAAIFIL